MKELEFGETRNEKRKTTNGKFMNKSWIKWSWLAVGLGLALGGMARAAETIVEVAAGVSGAWVVPEAGWDGRTVLLFHGFASDRDDAGGLLKRLAQALEAKGIATLRINFRGEGDSKRTAIESTFTIRLEDAAAAREWVVRQKGVAAEHVGLAGWSLGASTAIESGARHPAWFRTIAVWSSPSGDAFQQIALGEMKPAYEQAARDGIGTLPIAGWKTVTLKKDFFESFRGIDVDAALAKYPGAFLAVRGSEDMLPQHEAEFMKLAKGRPAEAAVIAGADHIFNVFDPKSPNAARVLAVTVAWFERTL